MTLPASAVPSDPFPFSDSLEERVDHYVKRRKLDPAILDSVSHTTAAASMASRETEVPRDKTELLPGVLEDGSAVGRGAEERSTGSGADEMKDDGSDARPEVCRGDGKVTDGDGRVVEDDGDSIAVRADVGGEGSVR